MLNETMLEMPYCQKHLRESKLEFSPFLGGGQRGGT